MQKIQIKPHYEPVKPSTIFNRCSEQIIKDASSQIPLYIKANYISLASRLTQHFDLCDKIKEVHFSSYLYGNMYADIYITTIHNKELTLRLTPQDNNLTHVKCI